jgi:flagellar protein FliT
MMNSQQVVSLYETMADISGQMLIAARAANWAQLESLEQLCARHVEKLKSGDRENTVGELRERKIRYIQKILADDREIRNITEPWMTRLSMQINSVGAQRKLAQAYGPSHAG